MAAELFMRVNEVAEVMGVSESYAYKIIRRLNKELKKTGCITMNGRIDRKFFYDNFYSTRENREEVINNGENHKHRGRKRLTSS